MKTPDDILRRLAENAVFGAPGTDSTLTKSSVRSALHNMPPHEARAALEEIESGVELERLKRIWEESKGMPDSRLVKALGPNFGPEVEALAEALRNVKGDARRRVLLKKVRGYAHRIKRQQDQVQQEKRVLEDRIHQYDRVAAEVNRFLHKPLVLERLDSSHFGQLLRDERDRNVFTSAHKGREMEHIPDDMIDLAYGQAAVFVVEHDWARAFESAPDVFTGPVTLPDTACVFEFRISGHIVIALIGQTDDNPTILPYIKTKEGWVTLGSGLSRHGEQGRINPVHKDPHNVFFHEAGDVIEGVFEPFSKDDDSLELYTLIDRQIRAVGVALDAQVATKTAIRMSYKSNQQKADPKAKPFYSYHTVSLARRPARLEAREDDGLHVPGTKRRLHFRRGHFRHFDGWKTWVNWCLVGDPDLGFVDKHYKL